MGRNNEEYYPEKVVIMTGPSLGSSLKLILFGALVGSAGTLYWLRQNGDKQESVAQQAQKARELFRRATHLATRGADLALSAFPQWQEAVATAKATAETTEQQLQHNIENLDD